MEKIAQQENTVTVTGGEESLIKAGHLNSLKTGLIWRDLPFGSTVTLCGSMKWGPGVFSLVNQLCSAAGLIVLGPTVDCKDTEWATELSAWAQITVDTLKSNLDALHLIKISKSDLVIILNLEGYLGESTMEGIKESLRLGTPLLFLEPLSAEKEKEIFQMYLEAVDTRKKVKEEESAQYK